MHSLPNQFQTNDMMQFYLRLQKELTHSGLKKVPIMILIEGATTFDIVTFSITTLSIATPIITTSIIK
jgi:hypothetical protein